MMQAVLDGPLPKFVALPGRFRCVVCNDVLKDPWQTQCGHRMCVSCLERIFETAAEVMCPALDEDCVMISKDRVSISCWIHKIHTSRYMSNTLSIQVHNYFVLLCIMMTPLHCCGSSKCK